MQNKALQDQTLPVTAVKPVAIRRAIGLLWASLAIGVVKTPLNWAYFTSRASAAFNAFVMIFTFAIIGFFIWKIGQGKNWARIVFLALFVIGSCALHFHRAVGVCSFPGFGILSTLQSGASSSCSLLNFHEPGSRLVPTETRLRVLSVIACGC